MKIAFLVLAHRSPAQTGRLCDRLSSDCTRAYVHVDAKADIAAFARAVGDPTVILDTRVDVRWGAWGMVEATLALIDRALSDAPDHLYLVSGQDYPIKPLELIVQTVAAADCEWMTVFPMSTGGVDKPRRRITNRFQPLLHMSRPWARRLRLVTHGLNMLLPQRDPERYAPGVALYGGASWWCVSAPTMRRMRALHAERPGLIALFKRAQNPDEAFFQTSLMAVAADRPRRANPTHVRWDKSRGAAESPEVLTIADLDALRASDRLLARKFDAAVDGAVLDRLDQLIGAPADPERR